MIRDHQNFVNLNDASPLVDGQELHRLLRMVWMHRVKMMVWFALGLALTPLFVAFKGPEEFKATALVRFEYNENLPETANPSFWKRNGSAELTSEVVALTSDATLAKLVQKLNLANDPRILDAVDTSGWGNFARASEQDELDTSIAKWLSERITVKPVEKSFIFEITAHANNPIDAENWSNGLAQLSIDQAHQNALFRAEDAANWYSNKAASLKVALDQADAEIAAFSQNAVYTNERDLRRLRDRATELRQKRDMLISTTQVKQDQLDDLLAAKQDMSPIGLAAMVNDPQLSRIIQAGDFDKSAFNTRFEQVIASLQTANARDAKLYRSVERNLADVQTRIDRQTADASSLQEMKRVRAANLALYETYLEKLKEASAAKEFTNSARRIVSKAQAESVAILPNGGYLVLGGIVFLLIGLTQLFYGELSKPHLRQKADVTATLGARNILEIPKEPLGDLARILKLSLMRSDVPITRAWRGLRAIILREDFKHIVITSTSREDGKTLTALGLAQVLGSSGRRVLIVDGQTMSTSLQDYFKVDGKAVGLTDSLTGGNLNLIDPVETDLPNVDFLSAGTLSHLMADLIAKPEFPKVIHGLTGYDHIVIDSGAIGVDSVSFGFSEIADLSVLLVPWNTTDISNVKQAYAQLQETGGAIQVVLSQVDAAEMTKMGYGQSNVAAPVLA